MQESQNQQGQQHQQNLQAKFRQRLDERLRQVDDPDEAATVSLEENDDDTPETNDEETEQNSDDAEAIDGESDDSGGEIDDNPDGVGVHIDLRG